MYCPYHVPRSGFAWHKYNGVKKVFKKDGEKLNKIDNSKAIEYVGLNGNIVIKVNNKKFPGDLNTDSKNSFYLGRHIVRNGDRPQFSRRSPDPLCEFSEMHRKILKDLEIDFDSAVTIKGCFKTNKSTLQRTMIPVTNSKFGSLPKIELIKEKELAIKSAIRKLKIKELAKCEIDDIETSKFNLNTYAGFTFDEYLNKPTKKKALNDALIIAKERWNNISNASDKGVLIKRNEIFPHTFSVGARNKREISYENGDEVKSRAVHMPEFHGELCDSPWIDQISDEIKFRGKGPIYIGNNIGKYDRLYNDFFTANQIIEGDVVKFDSSLFINDIIIAVCLARLYYDIEDDSIDNHFLAIFDTIGIKDYITPGGYVYRVIHGLPSGVKSTSLFGSFINFINLLHCTRKISHRKLNYSVGGDDFLIGNKGQRDENLLKYIESEGTKIGYEFKLLAEKNFHAESYDDRPTFYKYTIDNNEPVVPTKVLIERMLFPWNKKYSTNGEVLKFLHDLLPTLGAPRTHCFLFYKLYSIMYEIVTKNELDVKEVYKMHLYFYQKVLKYGLPIKDKEKGFPITIKDSIVPNYIPEIDVFKIFKKSYNIKHCLVLKRRASR